MKLFSHWITFTIIAGFVFGCSTSRHFPAELADTYYGFLPCADCPGIRYQLELKEDGKYREVRDYVDRESVFEEEGEFTFKDKQILLWSDGKVVSRYDLEGERLIMLDGNGHRVESPLAPYYILYKGDPERSKDPEGENYADNKNLNYRGSGNEPFWGLQITQDDQIVFNMLMEEEVEVVFPATGIELSDDVKTITYSGERDGEKIVASITTEPCQDDMSGFHFPTLLEVHVELEGKEYQLRGCGQFVNQYTLTGSWELESINDEMLAEEKLPTLNLHLPAQRITGNGSCNRYFGQLESLDENSIAFGTIGATQMACPNMNLETVFFNFLNRDQINWSITTAGKLLLVSGDDQFLFARIL